MPEYEEALVGAALLDNSLLDDGRTAIELFTDKRLVLAVTAMKKLRAVGQPANLVTVYDETGGKLDAAFLSGLTTKAVAANADWYVERLRESLRQRTLRRLRQEIEAREGRPSTETVEYVQKGLEELRRMTCDLVEVDGTKVVQEIVKNAEERLRGENTQTGVPTGFYTLDHLVGGLQPEDLCLLAARTSVGKTALALSMANDQVRRGIPVAYASLEMSGKQVYGRVVAMRAGVSAGKLRWGKMSDEDFAAIMESVGTLAYDPLLVLDSPGLSMEGFTSWARSTVGKGARVVYLDYVGLVTVEGDAPRWEKIAEVSARLKSLARELKVPVVALVQMNRSAADAKIQGLHHLRDSGALEQDADVVLILERAEAKGETDERLIPATLHVAKHRNGPTTRIKLQFDRVTCHFLQRGEEGKST